MIFLLLFLGGEILNNLKNLFIKTDITSCLYKTLFVVKVTGSIPLCKRRKKAFSVKINLAKNIEAQISFIVNSSKPSDNRKTINYIASLSLELSIIKNQSNVIESMNSNYNKEELI